MMNTRRKKLIEVSIPLEAINSASKKQKAPKGYPTALHKYWAQRPLSACRAVLFAQLVDDPSAWPDRFPSEEAQDTERRRLHRVIERIVPWEASNNQILMNEARWEIARTVAWGIGEEPPERENTNAILEYLQTYGPSVYDPFSGGASIPLEAQRLGLRTYASDLNPVAVLIAKALIEIPPTFANVPPVNPNSRAKLADAGSWQGRGAEGLAEDVRFYGGLLLRQAKSIIGKHFPSVETSDGSEDTVVAWLWARTVRSPDPSARAALVPLVSSFMLSTKEGHKSWVDPVLDEQAFDGWRFEVRAGDLSKDDETRLRKGTKTARGSNFRCVLTGVPISPAYIRSEGMSGRIGARLMAVVAKGRGGRVYLSPSPKQEAAGTLSYEVDVSGFDIEMPSNPRWFSPPSHGMKTFASLFTQRQLLALTTFSELVAEVREHVLVDAHNAGLGDDAQMLQDGGAGPVAYADAVATYLAFCVSRAADYGSTISTWLTDDNAIRGTFGRQAVPMTWDFCEGNPFGESSAALAKILTTIPDVIAHQRATGFAKVMQTDAGKNGYTAGPFVINTDPPYYDNIGYADLSDFFYMWLRKSLASVWPDILRRLATPKDAELVATPYRHNGKAEAETFFLEGMGTALRAIGVAATDEQPIVIYYAFKQTESANDGITSAGWATFLQGIIASGLMVDGTWPLRTESGGRLIGRGANALASSIVLVCRKRPVDAPAIARAEFLRALKKEMPEAIDAIRKAGVVPVDMEQAVLGPGMGVFSRNERVLEDDDASMTVKTALALINRIWQEIENELDTTFDPETQVALAWYDSYGFDARSSGELIMLTTAKNTSDRALFQSCVFQDKKGKTALTPRAALSSSWSPSKDSHLTVWMCVQQVARVLVAENGGTEAAARLIAEMGATSADARKLAYRLFELATKKSWSAEALVYNELAEVWPKLEDLAIEMASRVPARAVSSPQADLFGMEA